MKKIEGNSRQSAESIKWETTANSNSYQAEMSISDVWRIVQKRSWLILFCALLGLALSSAYVSWKTPIYQGTAQIQIDSSRVAMLGLSETQPFTDDDVVLQTDIEILQSSSIAIAAVAALPDAEKRALVGPGVNASSLDRLGPAYRNALLYRVSKSLKCKRTPNTQIIQVTYRDVNRKVATDMANNIVDAFLKGAFQSRYKSVQQVSIWMSDQMKDLKAQSQNVQKQLARFQEANHILVDSTDVSSNTTLETLKSLSDQLTQAQADRISKESRYRIASAGNPELLTSVVPDAVLDTLQSQQAQVFTKYAELSSRFGTGYPPVQDVKEEMAKLKTEIDEEVKTLLQRLERDFLAATQTENTLRSLYDQQTKDAYILNGKVAEYALLKDEVDSTRNLYNILEAKLAQASVNAGLGSVNAIIMDKAELPMTPVEPQVPLVLAVGLVIGLATGIGSAFMGAAGESNVESIDQIESILKLPTLALVPRFTKEELTRSDASLLPEAEQSYAVALRLPRSRAAESYRTLRNSVLLSAMDSPMKTIVFTSALPGEGKSTSAINFAIVLAQKGSRVLLVDADLRRPSLSRSFKLKTLPGLSSCLLSDMAEDPVVKPINSIPALTFLPSGPRLPAPSEALSSMKFFGLIDRWSTEYDYVVFDSAPVLGISDSIPLASWADAVLVVTRFGATPVKALIRTRDVLARANARIQGLILNGADWASRDYYLDNYSKGYKGYYV